MKQAYIFESPFRKHHLANFSIHHFHTSWDTNISSDHLKHVSTIPMNVPWRFARYVTLSLHQIKAGSTTFSCMCVEKNPQVQAHTHTVLATLKHSPPAGIRTQAPWAHGGSAQRDRPAPGAGRRCPAPCDAGARRRPSSGARRRRGT